jgi:hypothetical protein
MADEAMWKKVINNLHAVFPETGESPPNMEMIPSVPLEGKVFVQKVVTEIYVYTDINNKIFGQQAFQDVTILGEMDIDKLIKMLNRQKKRRASKEDS